MIFTIYYLDDGDESPMLNHHPLEIAADDEAREFFVFGVMARTYGRESIKKSCRKYANQNWRMRK